MMRFLLGGLLIFLAAVYAATASYFYQQESWARAPVEVGVVSADRLRHPDATLGIVRHAIESGDFSNPIEPYLLQSLSEAPGGSNLLIYRALGRILSALQGELSQLAVVLLKGVTLANTIYPSIALRPMTHIDMLLRRAHLESAIEVLRSIGYRDVAPEMTPGLSRKTHFQVALKGGPRGYVIAELHWSLVGGEGDWRAPNLDWVWAETESWQIQEESRKSGSLLSALQLRPTAHLLYLAAHLMLQHGGARARLLWEYDIHLLVTQCERRLDWEELRRRARELRWAPALRAALARLHENFRTPLPDGFLQALEADGDRRSQRLVESKEHPVQTRATATWNYLRSLDWHTRLQRVRSSLWPTPAYLRWRYRPRPKWLWPLCYPYRWALFALESVRTVARLVWGRFGCTRKATFNDTARTPIDVRG